MRAIRSQAEWEQLRARGRADFILRNGVLRRGLPMGLVVGVALELYLGGRFPGALQTAAFWGRLALCLGVFSASGSITAAASWRVYERHFGGSG